ncbi:hypothetical protein GWI33_014113 [Rhynchophorus ferrugineus]|uniref:Uncharacterized protein n=1 Tax=Rhynchophorus ferrugineus TaxID=354439 RepID=A0A834MAX7_RHYFE|nr:hypothetical protein GWI33_014113 [Rhynchophorus ferrugineus]
MSIQDYLSFRLFVRSVHCLRTIEEVGAVAGGQRDGLAADNCIPSNNTVWKCSACSEWMSHVHVHVNVLTINQNSPHPTHYSRHDERYVSSRSSMDIYFIRGVLLLPSFWLPIS